MTLCIPSDIKVRQLLQHPNSQVIFFFFFKSVLLLAQWTYSSVAQFNCTSFTSFELSPSPDEAPSGGTAEKKQAECQRHESISSAWMKSAEYLNLEASPGKAANWRSSLALLAQSLCCTTAAKHLLVEYSEVLQGAAKQEKPHSVFLGNPWPGIHTAGLVMTVNSRAAG